MNDEDLWKFKLKFMILSVIRENGTFWLLVLMKRIKCIDKATIAQKS